MTHRASELIAGLKRIAVPYQAALDVLRAYEEQTRQPVGDRLVLCGDACAKLQPSLKLITECEEQLAPLRQAFRSEDACPETDAALEHSETLLRELLRRIDGLQKDLKSERDSLGEGIDQNAQNASAHQAYSTHS